MATRPVRPPPRPVVLVYDPVEADALRPADPRRRAAGSPCTSACASEEAATPVAAEADVLYAWKFPHALYARATRLAWLQAMGAGVDWVLGPELPPRVVVTRAPGVFGPWMASTCSAGALWVTQRMETYRDGAARARGGSRPSCRNACAGKTLAIVGLGDIGREIARAARARWACGSSASAARGARRRRSTAFIARATFAGRSASPTSSSWSSRSTAATRGLIDAAELAAMRPDAWLINVGRGAVVDDAALVQALDRRRLGGAVLDVFATEPLPTDHPLWALDNAVITPHISGPNIPGEIAPVFNDEPRPLPRRAPPPPRRRPPPGLLTLDRRGQPGINRAGTLRRRKRAGHT